jgi:hypothetical protein
MNTRSSRSVMAGFVRISRSPTRLALAFSAMSLTSAACGATVCDEKIESIGLPANTTPFLDGRSVLTLCDSCPVLPAGGLTSEPGPATACYVRFSVSGLSATVQCAYGKRGEVPMSPATAPVGQTENQPSFCATVCHSTGLEGCEVRAEATGVRFVACDYGQSCHVSFGS